MAVNNLEDIIQNQGAMSKFTQAYSEWAKFVNRQESDCAPFSENDTKREVVQIQWFVVIACSYLLIVQDGQLAHDPLSLTLLSLPLGLMAVLFRLPEAAFSHRLFPFAVALADATLFSIAIFHNRQSPWDLCLVFFFGILISAIGENLLQIIVGSLIVGLASVLIIPVSRGESLVIDANTLLRIPLIFGAALVYGHLSDQVKREKKRTARSEEMRQQQLSTKDRFLSHVSHELRTPLTAIYQFVAILSDGLAGNINEQQREYLDIVQRNVKQLQAMVSDLLDAARADEGKLTIDPRVISLQDSVHEVLTNHRASAAVKSINLSVDISNDLSAVKADPQRVKQIISNLIDNAIKFTDQQGNITISAQNENTDREFVRLSVSDTGCGISPDGVKRIFDRLYQEESMLSTNRKGLGLGLHICQELVSRQGGRIWVESELGKGTAFYFTLPAFSLRRLLAPFVEQSGGFPIGLAIIFVQVKADGRIETSEIGKAMWGEKWTRLTNVILPPTALLLPRMTIEGKSEQFLLLSAGDVSMASDLATRIEKEVGGSRRTNDIKCGIKTFVNVIDVPLPKVSTDLEALTEELSGKILSLAGLRNLQMERSQPAGVDLGSPSSRFNEPVSEELSKLECAASPPPGANTRAHERS